MERQTVQSEATLRAVGQSTPNEGASPAGGYPAPAETAAKGPALPVTLEPGLTPRMRQTLSHLLSGDSEKQIAGKLQISRHTVHVYIKQIYRRYNVNSRGELFARWVKR